MSKVFNKCKWVGKKKKSEVGYLPLLLLKNRESFGLDLANLQLSTGNSIFLDNFFFYLGSVCSQPCSNIVRYTAWWIGGDETASKSPSAHVHTTEVSLL